MPECDYVEHVGAFGNAAEQYQVWDGPQILVTASWDAPLWAWQKEEMGPQSPLWERFNFERLLQWDTLHVALSQVLVRATGSKR